MIIDPQTIFVGLAFCFAFGLRSVFGFGGTIFALAIVAQFYDIKEMVVLGAFAGIIAAVFIVLSDLKSFNPKIFLQILLATIPGLLLGTMFLQLFSSQVVLYTFGILLITYSVWTIVSPKFKIPNALKSILNFTGGVFSGTLGTPGPFFVVTMREVFSNKSQMRTTLSSVYIVLDTTRIPIYFHGDIFTLEKLIPYWWVVFPLSLSIWLGYKVHLAIPERAFQIGVSLLLGITGISFLFK